MKVSEKVKFEGDKMIVQKTHDDSDTLRTMHELRNNGQQDIRSDYRHVGRIPLWLVTEWLKEAGVSWDDVHARGEVIKRKILSGDFDKLRSDWKGSY